MIGVLLFLISVVLMVLTAPLGLLYGLVYKLFRSGVRGIGEYLLKIAISIDQLGNVIMQHLLNLLWIKSGGYRFGNRDETISSVLGKNKKLGTLSGFGNLMDRFLDAIDPNHSLNSIDYYVQPSGQLLEEVAWIYTKDRQLLCLRTEGPAYKIPSAIRNPADSDGEILFKMVRDTLGVELDIGSIYLEHIFTIETEDPRQTIRKKCYRANFPGSPASTDHIESVSWLGLADRDAVSEIDKKVFDYLAAKGELA